MRAFNWGVQGEELICATSTAYLTDKTLQELLGGDAAQQESQQAELLRPESQDKNQDEKDAPCSYSEAVEPVALEAEESNVKQVAVKLLDMNWVFIKNNTQRLLSILSSTDNDAIFAQA